MNKIENENNHIKNRFLEKTKKQIPAFIMVCNAAGPIQEELL